MGCRFESSDLHRQAMSNDGNESFTPQVKATGVKTIMEIVVKIKSSGSVPPTVNVAAAIVRTESSQPGTNHQRFLKNSFRSYSFERQSPSFLIALLIFA